jgi:hypothetical protein
MKSIALALVAAVAIAATPAAAVTFTVVPGTTRAMPNNNDFRTNLAAAGLTRLTTLDATVSLSQTARLRFDYMGSESGFVDRFKIGTSSFAETNKASWGATPMFTALQSAGPITNWLFTSNQGAVDRGIGTREFAIFLPTRLVDGVFTTRTLFLGFDDQINNRDDDHDDFIVRVTAVPEPQMWAMLITGFGLVGAARRRQRTLAAA